jgi:glycosyltransferase involved in cell wall biosynthesis
MLRTRAVHSAHSDSRPPKPILAIVQTVVSTFRLPVFEQLKSTDAFDVTLYAGDVSYEPSRRTSDDAKKQRSPLRNRFLFGRRFMWQSGLLKPAMNADVVLMEMNPRNLSTVLIAFLRRALKKPVVLWGHAWPRNGKTAKSDKLRAILRNKGDVVVVYTETQAAELRTHSPGLSVFAAPNALYSSSDRKLPPNTTTRNSVVFSGRLIKSKKPALLVRGFAAAIDAITEPIHLDIIGSGPEENNLRQLCAELAIEDRVTFHGEVFDYDAIERIYENAFASCSPGYVGLNFTQSLWFGVPMIISRDEPHAPEIEAAVEGHTCRYFETDSLTSLAHAMRQQHIVRESIEVQALATECRNTYSVETMSERLVSAVASGL